MDEPFNRSGLTGRCRAQSWVKHRLTQVDDRDQTRVCGIIRVGYKLETKWLTDRPAIMLAPHLRSEANEVAYHLFAGEKPATGPTRRAVSASQAPTNSTMFDN